MTPRHAFRAGRALWVMCAMLATLLAAFLGSASPSRAQPPPTGSAVEATLVALCTTSSVFANALVNAAEQCRAATPTPTFARPGPAAQATPTPPAFVLLPAPSIKSGLEGSVFAASGTAVQIGPPIVFGNRIAIGMTSLWDPEFGVQDGDGIDFVTFTIANGLGQVVHRYTTNAGSRFCAFGGQTPNCTAWDFSAHGGRWPDGDAVYSGRYSLFAFAQGKNSLHKGTWTTEIEIRLPADDVADRDGAVLIQALGQRSGNYVVVYSTVGFTPARLGNHLRFFFDTSDPLLPRARGVQDIPTTAAESATGIFAGFSVADRPPDARALCVAILQADDTIVPDSATCAALP